MADTQPKEYRQARFQRPPGACELLLVRHGESEPARPGEPFPLVDGHGDPALDPVGVAQAERAAERLIESGQDIAAIYVTSLRRTHQTAAPLANRLGLQPIVEPELREVHLGDWEGGEFRRQMALQSEIAVRMREEQRWDVIPNAEPADVFRARVQGAVSRIAANHRDQTVVVVTHGGVIGQILALATGSRPFAFTGCDNASISHVVVFGEVWIVRRFNDTAHLGLHFTEASEPLT